MSEEVIDIPVEDASVYPSTPPFLIEINGCTMQVIAIEGNILKVRDYIR